VKEMRGWTHFCSPRQNIKQKALERKKQMVQMRKDGKTYQEIGRAFGITRQRVYKILKDDE
jgi:DNA invertase Pin-like site-specific DNA recombinase